MERSRRTPLGHRIPRKKWPVSTFVKCIKCEANARLSEWTPSSKLPPVSLGDCLNKNERACLGCGCVWVYSKRVKGSLCLFVWGGCSYIYEITSKFKVGPERETGVGESEERLIDPEKNVCLCVFKLTVDFPIVCRQYVREWIEERCTCVFAGMWCSCRDKRLTEGAYSFLSKSH